MGTVTISSDLAKEMAISVKVTSFFTKTLGFVLVKV